MKEHLEKQGIPWQWVDGVLIESMDEIPLWERSDMEAYGVERLKTDPFYVRRAVGCKRAIDKALLLAASSEEEWVIVLQDDVWLCPNFISTLDLYFEKAPSNMDALLLFRSGQVGPGSPELVRLKGDVRSTAAFMVRPDFARKFHDELKTWGGEEDRIWYRMINKGHLIMGTRPLLASTDQKGSDIIGGIPELSYLWE